MELLFIGDIVGTQGIDAAIHFINDSEQSIGSRREDLFKIANAENASDGFGLTKSDYERLIQGGFDLLTSGNHTWDRKEILHYISKANHLVRPYNLPQGTPGRGWQIAEKKGIKLGVINLLGKVFMNHYALECPFRFCDRAIEELKEQRVDLILVDFHAEATSEKAALGHYLDGRVTAVVGSHTHVPTADERILPKGTAFITDAGACCAYDSLIGMTPESILPKFLTGLPSKTQASHKAAGVHSVKISLDEQLKACSIQRITRLP